MDPIDYGHSINDNELVRTPNYKEKLSFVKVHGNEFPSTSSNAFILENLFKDNWKWSRRLSKNHTSKDVQFYSDHVIFHPNYAWESLGIRGEKRLTRNTISYWKIYVPNTYGTSMMFGVGTINAKVIAPLSFEHLLGGPDRQSWGLAHNGKIYYNGEEHQFCAPFGEHSSSTVGILFDGTSQSLYFSVNDKPFRLAFADLNLEKVLYPMVSSTAQRSMFMIIEQRHKPIPTTLSNYCMDKILSRIRTEKSLTKLPLPLTLKEELVCRLTLRRRKKIKSPKRNVFATGKIQGK